MKCALDPTAEGCIVERDTTLFACSDNISGNGALYRLACKAQNGVVTSCNGKTNVDVEADGQLVRQLSGSCAQNGFTSGIIGGSSAENDTTPEAGNSECWAVLGSKCQMRDKASGNTFMCDCDGSCDYALRRVASGECQNPYSQPNDSLTFPESSGSEGGSSGSEGGSSGSEGDFEYDYTDVLEQIRGNTQYTGMQAERLNDKATTANEYLQQIAAKEFDPTINVNVDARDTINVEVHGDTARAPAAILGLLSGALEGGQPQQGDTAGFGVREAGLLASIDSALADSVPNMTDSIPNAVRGVQATFGAFKDSMANSAWNDSVTKWEGQLLDNGVLTGAGSDNCPNVLTRTWDVSLWNSVQLSFGPLGKYLCAVVPGVGVTFWALCRVIIRAVVSIACMVWIFKAVMGIDGGSSEED